MCHNSAAITVWPNGEVSGEKSTEKAVSERSRELTDKVFDLKMAVTKREEKSYARKDCIQKTEEQFGEHDAFVFMKTRIQLLWALLH